MTGITNGDQEVSKSASVIFDHTVPLVINTKHVLAPRQWRGVIFFVMTEDMFGLQTSDGLRPMLPDVTRRIVFQSLHHLLPRKPEDELPRANHGETALYRRLSFTKFQAGPGRKT